MKNQIFSTLVSLLLIANSLLISPIGLQARQFAIALNILPIAQTEKLWSFEASIDLPWALEGSVSISVDPTFIGRSGFEFASLNASINADEEILTVNLVNYAKEVLPANMVLGTIMIVDETGAQTFMVVADGIGTLVIEEEF
jgi:hypothetical protein